MTDAQLTILIARLDAIIAQQRAQCIIEGAHVLAIVALCAVILWALG